MSMNLCLFVCVVPIVAAMMGSADAFGHELLKDFMFEDGYLASPFLQLMLV